MWLSPKNENGSSRNAHQPSGISPAEYEMPLSSHGMGEPEMNPNRQERRNISAETRMKKTENWCSE
jgi:hypothetical protein